MRIKEDVTLGGDVILRVNFSSWWDVFVHEIFKMVQNGPWWGGFFGEKNKIFKDIGFDSSEIYSLTYTHEKLSKIKKYISSLTKNIIK